MNPPPPAQSPRFFEGPGGSMLRAVHEAIVVIDEAHTIIALNPAAEQLFDCAAGEALGGSLMRFIPPPWREQHVARVRAFAADQATPRSMAPGRTVEVLRGDGTLRPVEITLSRIEMVEAGVPRQYFAALMRDMTEQQALEEHIATLERRMRAVFELAPIAIWICDDERLVYANRAAAHLFGAPTIDSLLGKVLSRLLDPQSLTAVRQAVSRALAGETAGTIVDGRLVRNDGAQREVEIALAALPDHGHTTVQMVLKDVTERRREASDLERSRRKLRALSASVVEAREEERRRIARELHDELGQRLTALKIDLRNLAAGAKLAPDDPRVASMSAMLDDTLASVRRIASDLRPLMLDDLGLTAAIEWLARETSLRMGIPIRTRLPMTELRADQRVAIALYRMVQEALTNVARHAKASSVDVELRLQGDSLVLTVADDGIGLTDQALQRSGSFGLLGLYERAHMLGGEVTVGPRPGGGTQLRVRVPAEAAVVTDGAR